MSTKSLTGASITAVILSILQNGDSYGYDIISQVRERSGSQIEWKAGSLYPVMHRMQTNGWIEDYWLEPEGERRRRYYRITEKGRTALAQERQKWMMFHNILVGLWGDTGPVPEAS
ncbi:unnamed protein product [marine sediment metagenome]|uniref:Transcription regulator PadR N-terminal domain-containing protein n=1 Tax=marine sediment metagenome TaxID=412755 RepID=X0ZG57_9ZZZZ